MVVIISIVVIVVCIFFALYLNRDPKKAVKQIVVQLLKATVNYKVSFTAAAADINYVLVNISITNNNDHELREVGVSWYPHHNLIGHVTLRNPQKSGNINVRQLDYTSMVIPARVPANGMITGYLIFQSPDDKCPVDQIRVSAGDQSDTAVVHKKSIRKETTANKHF